MSEANKKIRDLERALRRERANVARATAERDRALSQVEELRRDNDHQRERRNAARDAVAKGQSARRAVEKECDQLKAALQRFMALSQHDRDLPLELFAIQRSVSARAITLGDHDAEVIERLSGEIRNAVQETNTCVKMLAFIDSRANQLRQQAKEVQS